MFDFDWDNPKAASNLAKHKVSFAEGSSVFLEGISKNSEFAQMQGAGNISPRRI